eukprot:gnl/TRDRNA2_/TRDRNA2_75654_c0_seq1.p1 gnl/TRDRNA2_/TRDRNA2_75654_c0~~gnl/TRDRNA2_/TRDRNA2_75654_c0_seq1.p1  ORF type:complete len:408 (+),score=66.87 gnl/TRDRNA2_/TRDRNA2_75654_c0_seq1:82-1305(+)
MSSASAAVNNRTGFFQEWVDTAALTNGAEPSERPRCCLRAITLNVLADGLATGSEASGEVIRQADCPKVFAADDLAGGEAPLAGAFAGAGPCFTFRCNADALVWSRRWPMLRKVILDLDADIIGLQEVDLAPTSDQRGRRHDKEIQRDFADAGYDGIFACKNGRASDGLGLFWRRGRLQPLCAEMILGLGASVHVAVAQPLMLDGSDNVITAVVTHFKAGLDVEAERMREVQARSLLQQLRGHREVILLADLNAHCRPWTDGTGATVQPMAYPLLGTTLHSAYATVTGTEPAFTHWGGLADREVRGVFDYVFFRGPRLAPLRVLRAPDAAQILRFPERLPNPEYPSDHVPLAVDFAFASKAVKSRDLHGQLRSPVPTAITSVNRRSQATDAVSREHLMQDTIPVGSG